MRRDLFAAVFALIISITGAVHAADPIEGDWMTPKGRTAVIAVCQGGFCLSAKDGTKAGIVYGRLAPTGAGLYEGRVDDPETNRTVDFKAKLDGDTLTLSACMAVVLCQSRDWTRL